MASYDLAGSGVQELSDGVGLLRINVSVPPTSHGIGRAFPASWYDIGLLRPMDDIDAYPAVPIDAEDAALALPAGITHLGYSLFGGAHIHVVEVIGPSPFVGPAGPTGPEGPAGAAGSTTLAGLTDVSLASLADGQLIKWDAASSSWVNAAAPAGGGTLTWFEDKLAADVVMSSAATDYDILSRSLAAGSWLLLAEIEAYNSIDAGWHSIGCKLWDGSTVYRLGFFTESGNSFVGSACVFAVATLLVTTTVKLTCRDDNTGGTHIGAANLGSPTAAEDTRLVCIKLS